MSAHCDVSAQQVHMCPNVSAHQVRSGSQDLNLQIISSVIVLLRLVLNEICHRERVSAH